MKVEFGKAKVVDLCDFGSNVVIVYSESYDTFEEFRRDSRCLRADPYWRDMVFVGGDCYFPRTHKQALQRRLRRLKCNT